MSAVTLAVRGMSCGGCASKVKKALEALDGVRSAEVVLATGAVTVDYDEGGAATPSRFREAVEDLGFDVAS